MYVYMHSIWCSILNFDKFVIVHIPPLTPHTTHDKLISTSLSPPPSPSLSLSLSQVLLSSHTVNLVAMSTCVSLSRWRSSSSKSTIRRADTRKRKKCPFTLMPSVSRCSMRSSVLDIRADSLSYMSTLMKGLRVSPCVNIKFYVCVGYLQ